jgi:hypothetical protein
MRPTGGPARPQETPSNQEQVQQTPQSTQNEDLDPLSLNDDDIAFAAFREGVDSSGNVLNLKVIGLQPEKPQPKQVNGFRVQIFAGAEEQVARMAEVEAHFEFDARIYLVFDSPNYKIRLGDFTVRDEADELRREAYRKGYRDAWVVPDQVWIGLPAEADTTAVPDTLGIPDLKEIKP